MRAVRATTVRALIAACAFGTASSLTGASLPAQRAPTPASVRAPQSVVSTNPFLLFWGDFQGEFERRLNAHVSTALAASWMTFQYNESYGNVDAKLRFYPSERALEGFGIAASMGVGFIHRQPQTCPACPGCVCVFGRTQFTVPTVATELGYQWLLGPRKRTAVTTSAGAKRYFASELDMQGDSRTRPMGRLSIGYAF